MLLSRILKATVFVTCILPGPIMLGQQMHHMKMKPDTSRTKLEHQHEGKSKPMVSKDSLIADGKYNCCLKNACDQCYREGENCDCYTMVKKDGMVCKECYEGWQKGEGRVPGVKKEHVKTEDSDDK